MRFKKGILALFITAATMLMLAPMPVALAADPASSEQFSLVLGDTYYFNLSAQDIPGTHNAALPDSSLKWVPFTYVGTVNAYSLDASSNGSTTASYGAANLENPGNTVRDRSLFVSDYNLTYPVSWAQLNSANLIFGKNYNSSGVSYTLRSLSVGSDSNNQTGEALRGTPVSNEWDQILDKNAAYIKNITGLSSLGQDTGSSNNMYRAFRGFNSARFFQAYTYSVAGVTFSFRPALEILNPDTLGSDGLKTVTFDMGDNGTLGNGSMKSAKVVYTGTLTLPEITAENGFNFTGSSTAALGWYDGSTFYAPGATISLAAHTTLMPGYGGTAPTITTTTLDDGTMGEAYSETLSATGDTPTNWSIDDGDLPAGLELDAGTGCITGTPTAPGLFTFTVKATNTAGSITKEMSISVTDTTPPTLSPPARNYDLSAPADVTTAITWNSSASVTNVVYSVSPDTTLDTLDAGDYTVSDDVLTIKNSFFSGLSLTTGAALEFKVAFNTGATATLTVNVVNGYTPSDDAELSSLSVNGTAVSGFHPDDIEYAVELPYGTYSAIVSASASDANAPVSITQASALPGSATVKVTAEDGSTTRTYTVNLTIAELANTYTVTFNSNGVVYATKTVNAGQSIGSAAWPAQPTRSSYTFGGWFTGENGAGTQFTSATPVNAAATVFAKWTYSGGGGSSSGGGSTTPATPAYHAEVSTGNGSNSTLPVTVDKSGGTARVDAGSVSSLMSEGKTSAITAPTVPDVDTYTLVIPVPGLSTQDEQGSLSFKTLTGTVTIPSNMLTDVAGMSGSKVEISIGQGDKAYLPSDVKAAIGDKPLISLTLSIDGKQTDWSNPNAPVTVRIPYTPTAIELTHPESIVIWYIDGSGNAVSVPNGHYDPATGTVTFTTTHFSNYAVVYNKVDFTDVSDTAWYSDAVGFISARGITTGAGNSCYSPDAKLTRGEFMVMLMQAYGIAPDESPTDNFSDAGSAYYSSHLAAAKRLGISVGLGNNMFAPEKEITRQEMFTLLYNALKVINQLPQGNSGKTLSDFADAGLIDFWAKDAMTLLVETGTIGGSAGILSPTATTTRAEMAQVLHNLLLK